MHGEARMRNIADHQPMARLVSGMAYLKWQRQVTSRDR
jgi:hypothetical protein